MKNLKKYIADSNKRSETLVQVFNMTNVTIYPADPKDLTRKQLEELAGILSSDLSPESLYQDGERSVAAAMKLKAKLDLVKADLESLGVTVIV